MKHFKEEEDGNYSYKGFLIGCDTDFLEHMIVYNGWTVTDCVEHVVQSIDIALTEKQNES